MQSSAATGGECRVLRDEVSVQPRDTEASVRVALCYVRGPRCNGYWQAAHHCLGSTSVGLNPVP
jgi:hypothetical protein